MHVRNFCYPVVSRVNILLLLQKTVYHCMLIIEKTEILVLSEGTSDRLGTVTEKAKYFINITKPRMQPTVFCMLMV